MTPGMKSRLAAGEEVISNLYLGRAGIRPFLAAFREQPLDPEADDHQ